MEKLKILKVCPFFKNSFFVVTVLLLLVIMVYDVCDKHCSKKVDLFVIAVSIFFLTRRSKFSYLLLKHQQSSVLGASRFSFDKTDIFIDDIKS